MERFPANDLDLPLARLAANQHGVVSLAQLCGLGFTANAVRQRAKRGRLHRIHRGVYAVGHAGLSHQGRWMAAVLALRPVPSADTLGGVLSHRSAAELWQLLPASPAAVAVDVTLPGDGGRNRRVGIRLHRSRTLTERETTLRSGIPVTTPARTLADLRGCISLPLLDKARRQAEVLGYPVNAADEPAPTRSELERRFLALCRRHQLPPPEVNAAIEVPVGARRGSRPKTYEVDFLWREPRLVVETDGYRYHRGRAAFEHDRKRQTDLAATAYEVIRFSWRQVVDEPEHVLAVLRTRLLRRSSHGRPLPLKRPSAHS